MIRAVLDANVLLSGVVGVVRETSVPGAILRAWRARAFGLITSRHIRTEVERTLTTSPSFASRLTTEQVGANLESLTVDATQATITIQVSGVATRPEDDLVLATASSAGADYLVTGDAALQALKTYHSVVIISPRAFLTILVDG